MTSARIAVLGMGRSGISVAKAALKIGANPVVYDESPAEDKGTAEALEELRKAGIEGVAGWDGAFTREAGEFVVISPGVPMRHPKLLRAVEEGFEILSEIEFAYRIAKAPIVGITGTNGKSTTTVMTWLCLKAAGVDAVLCGNIFGSGYEEVPLTQAAAESGPGQVLVAEISSFQLEWVRDFRPRAAAITNITPDHLNRYRSFEEYADVKRRIFRNMGEGDVAVWHAGDGLTEPPRAGEFDVLRFGGEGADAFETADDLYILGERLPKRELPWSESHNYRNAMCAGLLAEGSLRRLWVQPPPAAREKSYPSQESKDPHPSSPVSRGLASFRGLSHRMETLGERGGVKVVNNSMCTNPGALVSSSSSISAPQRILVGGVTKDLDFAPVRAYLDGTPHAAYVFGSDAHKINGQLGGRWPVLKTMREAFELASKDSRPGDVILLAPGAASTDQFEDFRDRGEAFRRMAKEWLDT